MFLRVNGDVVDLAFRRYELGDSLCKSLSEADVLKEAGARRFPLRNTCFLELSKEKAFVRFVLCWVIIDQDTV
ncbi:hypothetical protein SUGI_0960510 [Cryptomeria japonica]|nr:hypothetical protein SUGI_0960510 [Cryptomeria japonica]